MHLTLPSDTDQAGFTLVELLVAMMLLVILGSVTSTAIIASLRSTRQDDARARNNELLQTELQRITREVRVADPLRVATPTDLVVDVYRGTGCRRIEWTLTSGSLTARTQTWNTTTPCSVYPATTTADSDTGTVTRLTNITNTAPFSYQDHSGTDLGTTPTTSGVAQVQVVLVQSQPEARADLQATGLAELRNAA